jgi:FLVCR family MFS transporter
MFLNGAIPLFFELVVEVTFPIGEATTAGTMMLLSNLIQVLWLLVPMDQVGTSWMAWAVAAVTPLFAAVLLPLRFSGLRRVLDHGAPGEEGEAAVVDF